MDIFAARRLRLHDLEQVVTSSQQRSHFLRHLNGRLQTTQTFSGKCCFLAIKKAAAGDDAVPNDGEDDTKAPAETKSLKETSCLLQKNAKSHILIADIFLWSAKTYNIKKRSELKSSSLVESFFSLDNCMVVCLFVFCRSSIL